MNILVYNVAAEYAGALTILKQFHNEVISSKDKSHMWYFAVSTNVLKESDNVKIIRVPWVKKSWLHRLWYDKFCAKNLVQQYDIDFVFSMQNMPIQGVDCKQIVYLHQSLQFAPVKYSIWKKEERPYWIRQNIISNMMKSSLRKAESIIVQTQWMKEATRHWIHDFEKKIAVVPPTIEVQVYNDQQLNREKDLFIYPAAEGIYKNHHLIIKACEILKKKNVSYKVLFTLDENSSSYTKKLYSEVKEKGLNIEFVGVLSHDEIMKLYRQATLVFSSYLESFGLPLLEAKMSDGVILCSDLPFAHEILDDYDKVQFFDIKNALELAECMEKRINNVIKMNENMDVIKPSSYTREKTLVECVLKMQENLE